MGKNNTKGTKMSLKHRIMGAVMSAAMAANAVALNAFAAEGSGVNYSEIGTALTSGLSECVTGIVSVASTIIPLGVGIYGIGFCVKSVKNMFTKIAG